MLLIIQNGRIVATAEDGYTANPCDEAVLPVPDGFREDYVGEYRYVDGELTFPTVDVNKSIRNAKLAECDWTQIGDVPITVACLTAFQVYRQALRDLDMLNPVWPDAPAEEWA